ncbi:MAG: hypothetical protein MJ113_03130 [Lachnospiraceae bacterium]|nr:hypothetical protein [Lachnospiraceae bacterium]
MKERTGINNKRTYLRTLSGSEFQVDYQHPVTSKRIRRNIEVSNPEICDCIDRLIDYVTDAKPNADELYTFLKTNEYYCAFADELFPIMQLIYANYLTSGKEVINQNSISQIFSKQNKERKYEGINTFTVIGSKDKTAFVLSRITGLSQKTFNVSTNFYIDYLICPDFIEAQLHLLTKNLDTDVLRFFSTGDPVKEKLNENLYLTKYVIADSSKNNIEYLLESLFTNKELSSQIIGLRLVYPVNSELRTYASVKEPFIINSFEMNTSSCYPYSEVPKAACISLSSSSALILAGDTNKKLKKHFLTRFNNSLIFDVDKEDEVNDTISHLIKTVEKNKKTLAKAHPEKKNPPDNTIFVYDYKKLAILYKEAYDEFFKLQEMLLDKAFTSPEDLENTLMYLSSLKCINTMDEVKSVEFSPVDDLFTILSSKISNFIDNPKSINIKFKDEELEKAVKTTLVEQKRQSVMEALRNEIFNIFCSDKACDYYLSLLKLKEQKSSASPLYEAATEIRKGIFDIEYKLVPDIASYMNSTVIEHLIDKIEKMIAN